jgi:hypothetical protein
LVVAVFIKTGKEHSVAFLLGHYELPDYQSYLQWFYEDPLGRMQVAKRHQIFRSVDNPNEIFVAVEFDSVEEARAYRRRLLDSGMLDHLTVKNEPTVVEPADIASYAGETAEAARLH